MKRAEAAMHMPVRSTLGCGTLDVPNLEYFSLPVYASHQDFSRTIHFSPGIHYTHIRSTKFDFAQVLSWKCAPNIKRTLKARQEHSRNIPINMILSRTHQFHSAIISILTALRICMLCRDRWWPNASIPLSRQVHGIMIWYYAQLTLTGSLGVFYLHGVSVDRCLRASEPATWKLYEFFNCNACIFLNHPLHDYECTTECRVVLLSWRESNKERDLKHSRNFD